MHWLCQSANSGSCARTVDRTPTRIAVCRQSRLRRRCKDGVEFIAPCLKPNYHCRRRCPNNNHPLQSAHPSPDTIHQSGYHCHRHNFCCHWFVEFFSDLYFFSPRPNLSSAFSQPQSSLYQRPLYFPGEPKSHFTTMLMQSSLPH
jgi:hypothetical protein